jgi:hypothetical protein
MPGTKSREAPSVMTIGEAAKVLGVSEMTLRRPENSRRIAIPARDTDCTDAC